MNSKSIAPNIELHAHLGSSVHPSILWSIAHRQGIKLPTKNYWEFEKRITMTGSDKNKGLGEMDKNFFHWTELIQSSPEAIEESVKSVIGGGYRKCLITAHELRFNPMLRNRGGERDLDHIIMSAVWGVEKALLEYPQVRAGIIMMMGRRLTFEQNKIITEKAIKYQRQGVVGLDIADPEYKSFSMQKHAPLFAMAKKAGLGITIHSGEAGSLDELRYVVRGIKPDRIGHGILCVKDEKLMKDIASLGIVLETCPSSNLRNSVVRDLKEMKNIYRSLLKNKIKFTINTDGPEMYQSNILDEQNLLLKNGILTKPQIAQCTKWAFEASFLK